MIEKKDLNKEHQNIVTGYETCMEDVFNLIVSELLGESLIGHYLSFEGNEKAAEEFRDEIYAYLIASKSDLILSTDFPKWKQRRKADVRPLYRIYTGSYAPGRRQYY